MLADGTFDEIVSGLYRAASGTIAWGEALRPLQLSMSAFVVQLFGVDIAQGTVSFSYEVGEAPPEALVDYLRTYHRIDPRAALVMNLAPGGWVNCWEHFDDAFVARDPFYRDFLIPYGGRYVSGTKLLQDGSVNVILGIHRGRGSQPLNCDEISICQRLARHLTEALTIHRSNLRAWRAGDLGAELLARLRAPVALIDDQRRLLYCNPSAKQLLGRTDALVDSDERLYCRRREDDDLFLHTLRNLQLSDDSQIQASMSEKAFLSVRGIACETNTGLYFYAVRPQATLGAFGNRSLAMLLFHEPGSRIEIDPFVIAATYDLTPAEARVGVALARGQSSEDIAGEHNVSISTVRSQLRSLFQKTGTSRQAELVSVLGCLPMAGLGMQ